MLLVSCWHWSRADCKQSLVSRPRHFKTAFAALSIIRDVYIFVVCLLPLAITTAVRNDQPHVLNDISSGCNTVPLQ